MLSSHPAVLVVQLEQSEFYVLSQVLVDHRGFFGFLLITLHCTYAKHKAGVNIKECPISFLKPLGLYIQGTWIISTTAFKNNLDKTLEV